MSLADQQWCPTSVQVTVLQARGLRIKGKSGTNDAYAVMQVGKEKYQTSVVEKSVAPVWKEEASFDLPPLHQGGTERGTLHVHVLHRALVGPDKLLGQAVINLLQLSEDKTRNKTEWFKLLDKTGKSDKDRGEVLVDIQFMRNNMTASMFDLSAAGKSRSRLGKFKDKVRGKKKETDSASNMVPSFTQVLTDSEDEVDRENEVTASKEGKNKKHKIKSLFSPKSNLQRNMSQSMSVLPAKHSSLSSSQSSGLNVDSSEGKKKFKFMIHKRSGSSDSKDPGHQKQAPVEQSNLCINGSHIYCEEPQTRASRIGSNFSLASSGHGSMEDVPENSPPSVDSLRAVTQYSAWTEEEEEEEDMAEEENENKSRRMEDDSMEEERRRKEEKEDERKAEEERRQVEERRVEEARVRREEEERVRREEEKKRQQEEERLRREEEKKRQQEEERLRREEEKKRQEEEERQRREVEKKRQEDEERLRREEEKKRQQEEERLRREEEKKRQQEEERLRREEEKKRQEEEERLRREEEKKRQQEEERLRREEEKKRQQEEERLRREEEKKRQQEEERLKREEEKKRRQEEERLRREEEKKRQEEEEERLRREEEKRREEEEERLRREEETKRQEEEERLRMEKKRRQEEERLREEQEKKRQEKERIWREEEKKRQEEEAERVKREAEEEKIRKEEQRIQEEKEEERRLVEEEKVRKAEEDRRRKEEEEKRQKEEEIMRRREEYEKKREEEKKKREEQEKQEKLMEEERKRTEAEEKRRREEEEHIRKEEEKERVRRQQELEEKRRLEEDEKSRAEQEKRKQEEDRIRKEREEEERRQKEEEEKARKEREEMERLAETRRREEQEKRRIEEEERARREEEERIRREERSRKEEEEARRLEKERLTEEQEKRGNKMTATGRKPTVSCPAEVISTNPFDENVPCNPSDSPSGPHGSSTGAQQRSSEGSKTIDEKELIGSQRERRPAPQPPGRNQTKAVIQKEKDVSMHQTQMNKQNKDKDAKTVSVLPQRSVQMITPLSRSPADTSSNKTTAKHCKRQAPSRPQTSSVSPEKPGYNPFEDDDDDDQLPDDASNSGTPAPIQWPPAVTASEDNASQTKIKSCKVARAPPPPAVKNDTSTSTAVPEGGCVAEDVNVADKPQTEDISPAQDQESPLKESQQNIVEMSVKKEAPPVASRRLQPVKPLNPQEQQSVTAQDETKVNDTRVKGPYSQLTREELISLVLKQEKQLSERDNKISELEQYIDNLLVRVIEEQPSILMSLNSLKKTA